MRTAAAFFIFVLMLGAPAFSAEKTVFAVLDLEARDVPETDAEKISHIIRNELSNSKEFQVLDGRQGDKGALTCGDTVCAVQAGKKMGAQKVLIGTLMKMGEQVIVTCRVIDVGKGTVDFAGNERALTRSDELYMAERLCEKVVRAITGKPLYIEEDKLEESIPVDRYRDSAKSSYRAAKDPFAWIALGSGIACTWGFAITHESYEWRTRFTFPYRFNDVYIWMLSPVFSVNPDFYSYLLIKEYVDRKNRHHRAEKIRDRGYYFSAGVGGFAVVMLATFIGRSIVHSAAGVKDAKTGDISFMMPVSYDRSAGTVGREQYTIGMGLSMKF